MGSRARLGYEPCKLRTEGKSIVLETIVHVLMIAFSPLQTGWVIFPFQNCCFCGLENHSLFCYRCSVGNTVLLFLLHGLYFRIFTLCFRNFTLCFLCLVLSA
uniref:Uncharacterized protein n=1 Tax=Rhizophora mucronata TaxID=61149 RepID=A0A2P2NL12_RHIMU